MVFEYNVQIFCQMYSPWVVKSSMIIKGDSGRAYQTWDQIPHLEDGDNNTHLTELSKGLKRMYVNYLMCLTQSRSLRSVITVFSAFT